MRKVAIEQSQISFVASCEDLFLLKLTLKGVVAAKNRQAHWKNRQKTRSYCCGLLVRRDDKIACGDLLALLITQEAPSRLRRNGFVFPSA
jgi:hypothetical protein